MAFGAQWEPSMVENRCRFRSRVEGFGVRMVAEFILTFSVASAMLPVGCNRGSVLGTVPVSGKVTYRGQAVANATVTFIGEGDARAAVAVTDPRGVYRLKTLDSAGATPGKYVVLVSQTETASGDDKPISMDEAAKNRGKAREPKQLLPPKYSDPAKTPLKYEVQSGRTNTFDLQLVD